MQPYLVRATATEVNAGFKDLVLKFTKKAAAGLLGIGLLSGMAHGRPLTLNKTKLDTLTKDHNAVFKEAGSSTRLKVFIKKNYVEYHYMGSDGGTVIRFQSSGDGQGHLDMRQAGTGGDELAKFAAQGIYEQLKDYLVKDKVIIK